MRLDEIKDYNYTNRQFDFANVLNVEQSQNKNGTVNTFYNLNDGFCIDGIDDIPEEDIQIYTCKNGDDLRFISYDIFGTTSFWWLIAKINGMEDCTVTLKPGQKLKILPRYYMNYIYKSIRENI